MELKIKSLKLSYFKGVKEAEYAFGHHTNVLGKNSVGKTTLMTAWMWLMADKDAELHSNPPIRPDDAEECTPRVEAVIDIDGQEILIAKQQKMSVSKPGADGTRKVSLSNTYEINSVPKSEKDFKAYLSELGVDFDLFLPLSHPDVFTGKKAEDMRKVLFSMASEKTDSEISGQMDGVSELSELLKNYTAEEIKAMQNATLRKIREEYGKSGEIIRAKIEGMEMQKVDIDLAELELLKNSLLEQIEQNREKQESTDKQFEEYDRLSGAVVELKAKLSEMERTANEENHRKRLDLQSMIAEKKGTVCGYDMSIKRHDRDIENSERDVEVATKERNRLAEQWKAVKAEKFDESTAVCPTCKRELPQEDAQRLLSDFEKSKAERLDKIEKDGIQAKQDVEDALEAIKEAKKKKEEDIAGREQLLKEIDSLEKQLEEFPSDSDITDTLEYATVKAQLEEKERAMNDFGSAEEARNALKREYEDLHGQLVEVEKQLALATKNNDIDSDIADLRKKQKEYEQSKADCEKILAQLNMVDRKKNELLTDEINRHFDIVRWQMFEFQKNGEYKTCCVPLIDGKKFGESTNTGREVLAKLDIIKGLQSFYGQFYPVFLDGAECLSEETEKRIAMDCQWIFLKVPTLTKLEKSKMTPEEIKEYEEYYNELRFESEG